MYGLTLSPAVYLDTNIFIYAVDKRDIRKHHIARNLVEESVQKGICAFSVQVMAEWRNVMIRKFQQQMGDEYRLNFLRWMKENNPSPMTGDLVCRAEEICKS